MGGKEKKKEPSVTSSNNRQHHQDNSRKDPARKRSDNGRPSSYSGSYVSYDSESSGRSEASNGDGYRNTRRKREAKRPRKERARHGRVAKPKKRTQKQAGRQRKKQTKTFARAMANGPEKGLSISTIMSKVSTKSSMTVYSNAMWQQQEKQRHTQLHKEERKFCIQEILKRMRACRKSSITKAVVDDKEGQNKTECIDVDEEEATHDLSEKSLSALTE